MPEEAVNRAETRRQLADQGRQRFLSLTPVNMLICPEIRPNLGRGRPDLLTNEGRMIVTRHDPHATPEFDHVVSSGSMSETTGWLLGFSD